MGPELSPGDRLKFTKGSLEGSFIVYMMGPTGLPIQFTVHHPIGVTDLADRSWVITPTSDIAYLKANKVWPEYSAWMGRKQRFIRNAVLSAKIGREKDVDDDDDPERWVEVDANAPICKDGIRIWEAAALTAGASKGDWLRFAPADIQVAEAAFKSAIKDLDGTYAAGFDEPAPPGSTMGGATGTIPQVAVGYLGQAPPATAYAIVRNRILGIGLQSYEGNQPQVPPAQQAAGTQAATGNASQGN